MEHREREPDRTLLAAFLALSDNRFWQQFCQGLTDKRGYLSRRLREAEDFAAFRFFLGQLELTEQLLGEIAEMEERRSADEF